jgi:hypothetical protein
LFCGRKLGEACPLIRSKLLLSLHYYYYQNSSSAGFIKLLLKSCSCHNHDLVNTFEVLPSCPLHYVDRKTISS